MCLGREGNRQEKDHSRRNARQNPLLNEKISTHAPGPLWKEVQRYPIG
jgi:hypothetical protein